MNSIMTDGARNSELHSRSIFARREIGRARSQGDGYLPPGMETPPYARRSFSQDSHRHIRRFDICMPRNGSLGRPCRKSRQAPHPEVLPRQSPHSLTEVDVERLFALNAKGDDWVFSNRIKAGRMLKTGRSGTKIFWRGAFRKSRGVFFGTGERHRWWRHVCPSRQRRGAWGTRDPIFFSSSTLMPSTSGRTRQRRR
jgi:hypothetical protein